MARLYETARCVFLDCDGVIFDSNGFKLEALRHSIAEYPRAAREEMELFWSAHGGMGRRTKLEHFFRNILKLEAIERHVEASLARFGEFSRRAYESASPIASALALARHAGEERCFVVSGADQAELRDVFGAKALTPLFREVCGSPTAKLAHVKRILEERGCPASAALLIGDGAVDFDVCQHLGVPFIYLDEFSEWTAAKSVVSAAENAVACATWSEILSHLQIRS